MAERTTDGALNLDLKGIRVISAENLDDKTGFDVAAILDQFKIVWVDNHSQELSVAEYIEDELTEWYQLYINDLDEAAEYYESKEEAEKALRSVLEYYKTIIAKFQSAYEDKLRDLQRRYPDEYLTMYHFQKGQHVIDRTAPGRFLMALKSHRNRCLRRLKDLEEDD